jgi:hypothetical protein
MANETGSALMATKSQSLAVGPSANQSRSLEIDQSNPRDRGPEKRRSPSVTRGLTGPRTQQGKEQSKHNALKHGIFSKVTVLKSESQAEFDVLLKRLREDRKPDGALEELFVDKLAVLFWRFRRLLSAEGAEIQVGSEFAQWDKNEQYRQKTASFPQLTYNGGLLRWVENPEALQGCINLLQDLQRSISASGFLPQYDQSILTKLYGRKDEDSWNNVLSKSYEHWYDTSLCEDKERKEKQYATPQRCQENFLDEVKKEIRRLERYRKEHTTISACRLEVEALRLPEMDRLLRYETTISREIERTLNQLERLQRMRLGQAVPPPIHVNVTSSTE